MQLDWCSLVLATIISQHGNGVSIVFHELAYSMEDSQLAPPTFLKYVDTLPEVSQCLLCQVRFIHGGEQALVECLQEHKKIWAASDGSLDPDKELALFGLHLIGKGNVLVEGAGPVDGIPDTLSSTRAELFGIAAIDEFLLHFCMLMFHNIISTSHVIKCCEFKSCHHPCASNQEKLLVEEKNLSRCQYHCPHYRSHGRIHSEDLPQLGQGSSGQDETIYRP